MADKQDFASANKAISIAGGGKAGTLNAKALLTGMTKDVKKRWYIVGGVTVVSLTLISAWMSSGDTPAPRAKPAAASVDTTPRGMSAQKDWKAQAGADMALMRQQLEESKQGQRQLAATMEALRLELKTKGTAPTATAPVANNGINLNLPPPPEPPKTLLQGQSAAPGTVMGSAPSMAPNAAAPAAPVPPVEVKRTAARSFIPTAAADTPAETAVQELDEMNVNDKRGYLPAGSFAKASLLSGVEAFTGGTAQASPQPIVIRLDANAVLPNAAAYDIKGCHVLASVWGDMSSERVFGRLATMTCVDSKNRLVLSEEVEGTLVDSDGKNGIRGLLQDRQGAKLARSLLAGFAEGMATALGSAQSTVTNSVFGSTTSVDPAKMLKSSGYGGANKAAEQLSDFYLKQAETTMPIIAVDVGRKISVLFTKSKALKFETIDTYKVKPKDKLQVVRELK